MTLRIYDFEQGSDEWLDARRGKLTASVIGQLITAKTIKPASNDVTRAITMQLIAERITGYSETNYVNADMERGNICEPMARQAYAEQYAPVTEIGFMVRDRLGFSPDGLVGTDGLVEIKAPRQKKHLATILADEVPIDNMAQCQAGLAVSGREWCDFISYCGGMPLYVKRVFPDKQWQDTIWAVLGDFEDAAELIIGQYETRTAGLPLMERGISLYEEMTLNGHH